MSTYSKYKSYFSSVIQEYGKLTKFTPQPLRCYHNLNIRNICILILWKSLNIIIIIICKETRRRQILKIKKNVLIKTRDKKKQNVIHISKSIDYRFSNDNSINIRVKHLSCRESLMRLLAFFLLNINDLRTQKRQQNNEQNSSLSTLYSWANTFQREMMLSVLLPNEVLRKNWIEMNYEGCNVMFLSKRFN